MKTNNKMEFCVPAFWSKRYGGIDEGIFPFKAGGEKLIFRSFVGETQKRVRERERAACWAMMSSLPQG